MRSSGILLHISSLPGPYGIGTFGDAAYQFIDFLKKSKQSYWQILPLGPTSYGDSPYQTFSGNALNHYFIDLNSEKKKILIAGCGTGQQILNYSGINDVDICAVDISKTSLGYAKRMTDQYKIQNIKY